MGASQRNEIPPALLLGTGLTVLGVLRSLGRAGIPALCLSEEPEFEVHSRWYAAAPFRIGPWAGATELAERLEALPHPRAVVIPCSDHWTVEATRLPARSAERFRACLPATDVLERVVDKDRFRAAVAAAGVPHPPTHPVPDERSLCELMASAPGEVFLKPVDSQRFLSAFQCKAFTVSSLDEARDGFRRAAQLGIELVLQEYVPGGSDQHYFIDGFVDREHRIASALARRRLRMHPPGFGNSSCVVTVPLEEVAGAVASLGDLFANVGYRGAFSAEFKRDVRDGALKILEVNCRPWWYVEFASRCGVNVPEMIYRDALDEPFPRVNRYPLGAELVYTYHDFCACRRMARSGELAASACLRSWLHSHKAIFAWDDPAPAVWKAVKRVRNWLVRRAGKRRTSHS